MSERKGKRAREDDPPALHWSVQRAERKGKRRRKGTRYRKSSGYAEGWKQIIHSKVMGSLSPRVRLKMGYAATFVLGDLTVSQALNIFRLNSVWDPDYTGTGVTVTGYSTFANLFTRYFVHGSTAEVTAEIRDTSANTVNAVNVMVGCSVSDGVPATPTAGGYDTELTLDRYKLRNLPRGTTGGGFYRFHHNKLSRNTAGTMVSSAAGNLNKWVGGAQGPTAYHFKDKRSYHLEDPLATLTTGGMIEHEAEGEFPLTSAYNNVPIDGMFLGVWAFSLPMDAAAVKPLPYTYFNVSIIYDVEWYAPIEMPAPSSAAAGVQAGLDAAMPVA